MDGRPFCERDGNLAEGERFVIGERYMIDELIGGGGFGFVFGGRHLVLGKPVAIKILRDQSDADSLQSKRFLREARNASQLAHENIISILDFGRCATHDLAYLVMERFSGVMLSEVIRHSAPMPVSRALPILIQLARAVTSAHASDVMHRDVNPRNILVGRGDFVKLCDFGLSRSLVGGDRVTTSGAVMGTPAYMAPEQIRGDEPIDHRVDVYGFGCTAYEMLTGRVPHGSTTPVVLLSNRLNEGTIEAFNFAGPPELEELIVHCLAASPADRPTAAELEAALVAISAGSGRGKSATDNVQRIGNYRVVRLLGRGGASSVYLGEHPMIGTKVAIKVLHPEVASMPGMAERFVQEARTSGDLGNPHIPRYLDFGVLDSGQPYAVLEFLEGESLAARLGRTTKLSIVEVTEIVSQTARAMAQVHAAGIVHRDLKPDNLFLTTTPSGQLMVKILDFGIAKALAPGASSAQTCIGLTLGTPAYCSPEQAMGLVVGPAADIYALGATAFEMLTGRPPFDGDSAKVMGAKVTKGAPSIAEIDPHVPVAIAITIDRMLARDPAYRMKSMAEVLDALADWLQSAQAPTEVSSLPRESRAPAAVAIPVPLARDVEATTRTDKLLPPRRKRRLVLAGAAVVVAVAALAFGLAFLKSKSMSMIDQPASIASAIPAAPVPAAPAPAAPAPRATPPTPAPAPVAEPKPEPAPAVAKPPKKRKPPAPKVELKTAPTKPTRDDAIIVDPYDD